MQSSQAFSSGASANLAVGIVEAGTPAPDFELHTTPDQKIHLRNLRGRPVILAFYPADWSPVCGDQMALYNEVLPEFRRHDAELLGISVDGIWCHLAFAESRKLRFPLLSDFQPRGAVAAAYGCFRAAEGTSERALFVIDGQGDVRWSYLSPVGINPGADGILSALEALDTKTLIPPQTGDSHGRPNVAPRADAPGFGS